MTKTEQRVPFTPDLWNYDQVQMHNAVTLEDAFYKASCLAGGWYRRPVTIDMRIVGNQEFYFMRPSDATPMPEHEPIYTVTAHSR